MNDMEKKRPGPKEGTRSGLQNGGFEKRGVLEDVKSRGKEKDWRRGRALD